MTSKFIDELVDETLPYADNVLPAEVILVFILAGIEALRLFFGKYIKGRNAEKVGLFEMYLN